MYKDSDLALANSAETWREQKSPPSLAGLTLLAEVAIPVAELNAETLAGQIKDLEDDVADAKSDEARRKASENLEHLKALQGAI